MSVRAGGASHSHYWLILICRNYTQTLPLHSYSVGSTPFKKFEVDAQDLLPGVPAAGGSGTNTITQIVQFIPLHAVQYRQLNWKRQERQ